jgi:hypothetical protein
VSIGSKVQACKTYLTTPQKKKRQSPYMADVMSRCKGGFFFTKIDRTRVADAWRLCKLMDKCKRLCRLVNQV